MPKQKTRRRKQSLQSWDEVKKLLLDMQDTVMGETYSRELVKSTVLEDTIKLWRLLKR